MLKTLQARPQQYMNHELPDVQTGFRKGRGTSAESLKKQKSSRKKKNLFLLYYDKAFDCVDHHKMWKILKEMGIPDYLNCLLRNLYAGQETQLELGMEQQSGSKWKRSTSRLYIVTLLI